MTKKGGKTSQIDSQNHDRRSEMTIYLQNHAFGCGPFRDARNCGAT